MAQHVTVPGQQESLSIQRMALAKLLVSVWVHLHPCFPKHSFDSMTKYIKGKNFTSTKRPLKCDFKRYWVSEQMLDYA